MVNKPKNEAKASAKAIIFQICIAVKKCFELLKGEKVFIEDFGDVTISGKEQIEAKQYSDVLTDNHPNFWKTLKNWLDKNFKENNYKSLILLTTQSYSPNTNLRFFNNLSTANKFKLLKTICNKSESCFLDRQKESEKEISPSKVLSWQRFIFDSSNEDKLLKILSKIEIAANSPNLNELYSQIIEREIKGVLEGKKEDFLNSLIGFVAKPGQKNESFWEITFEEFSEKLKDLNSLYCMETRRFPKKYLDDDSLPNSLPPGEKEPLFIKKIKDIPYDDVIPNAVADYLKTFETINEEFKNYEIPFTRLDSYRKNLIMVFSTKYKIACRHCKNPETDSKNFYDETICSDPMRMEGFDIVPYGFRNGLLHIEQNDQEKNLFWRLLKEDE